MIIDLVRIFVVYLLCLPSEQQPIIRIRQKHMLWFLVIITILLLISLLIFLSSQYLSMVKFSLLINLPLSLKLFLCFQLIKNKLFCCFIIIIALAYFNLLINNILLLNFFYLIILSSNRFYPII